MEEKKLHPVITVRLYTDEKCFGPGVAMLLERVERLRSLRSAAMDMDMAYSKAWTILRNAERQLGFKLISSTTGGRHGGGAVLTAEGERMLAAYNAYAAKRESEEKTRRIRELEAGMGALEERLAAAVDAVAEAEERLAGAREESAAAKGDR